MEFNFEWFIIVPRIVARPQHAVGLVSNVTSVSVSDCSTPLPSMQQHSQHRSSGHFLLANPVTDRVHPHGQYYGYFTGYCYN